MPDIIQIIGGSVPEVSGAPLFFLLFLGTFASEDAACLAAGAAVANGRIELEIAILACFLGIFIGDMILFAAGRAMGEHVFDNRHVKRFISIEATSKARRWLEMNGAQAVFISRFATGLRLPTYIVAGALGTDIRKFAFYFLMASAIWTPLLIGTVAFSQSVFFRENIFIGLVAAFIVIRVVLTYSSWKNRRLLLGRLKRFLKWEFWPVQVFYAPVVGYVLWLALRYRNISSFTAVNPSIPAGGFRGESKNDIYKLLERSPDCLLPYTLIVRGQSDRERLRSAWQFMDENRLSFPVVVKPDAGERGRNVSIVRSFDELTHAVTANPNTDLILQQYVGGTEVSVFYYRYPHEERGHIFSITEKKFPIVCGDGASTIEELILRDARAVSLAAKYIDHNKAHLERVPACGEEYKLIDIGTHSRGAIFLDGERLRTPELEARIEAICTRIEGFYFGRFDIRVPTVEDLKRGENLKVIELNGVTSESTNIYDPGYSLFNAYRILFRQWRIAFAIGAENIKLGAKQTSLVSLAKLAFG